MSRDNVCAQMERGEFEEEVERRERGEKLERGLLSPNSEQDGVLDGFWEHGIGTGIGIALLSGAGGWLLGINAVVGATAVAWSDLIGVPAVSIETTIMVAVAGAIMLGAGVGYQARADREVADES